MLYSMQKNLKIFKISDTDSLERLDIVLSKKFNISRSKIITFIKDGKVTVNAIHEKPSYKLKKDDEVILELPNTNNDYKLEPEDIPLDIIYEDENLIIINKPRGMLTHPSTKVKKGSLVNALLNYSKELSSVYGQERAGIVHRLDKDTTGLLIVAKNNITHMYIAKLLKERKIEKRYIALVHGNFKENYSRINIPLINDPKSMKVKVSSKGKFAVTDLTVMERFVNYTLLDIRIHTGRTHQIRVHLSYIGHPIVGDYTYGMKDDKVKGQLLHCYKLCFNMPNTFKLANFTAPLPEDFSSFLDKLRNN